jgi:hypothetical protein
MSYVVTQQPDAYSLTSTIKDIILTTTDVTDIDLKINGTSVLAESYTPDADNKIYIRELGKLIAGYLAGSGFDNGIQTGIVATATIYASQEGISSELGEYNVMLCNAYTTLDASNYFNGNVFLHAHHPRKQVLPTTVDYITASFTTTNARKIKCFVTTSDFVNSAKVDYYTSVTDTILTVQNSLDLVAAKFPAIDKNSIIAYRLELPNEIAVFMIDRANYLTPLQFRFTNYFGVPSTVITRGNVVRKGSNTFEMARIGGVDIKFNSERSDVFTVDAGKLFNATDADRFREMFDSENVEVYFNGQWIKVIVSDESSEQSLRTGNSSGIQFSFGFADVRYNNTITAIAFMRWILEDGTWQDGNVWMDAEHWNDGD